MRGFSKRIEGLALQVLVELGFEVDEQSARYPLEQVEFRSLPNIGEARRQAYFVAEQLAIDEGWVERDLAQAVACVSAFLPSRYPDVFGARRPFSHRVRDGQVRGPKVNHL